MRRYTYILPKPYYIINTTLCVKTLYFATTAHQHRSSETIISSPTSDYLVPSPSLASEAASTSLSKLILEYSAPSPTTKGQLSTCYRSTRYRRHRSTRYRRHRSSPTITPTDVTSSQLTARHTISRYLTERRGYHLENFHTSASQLSTLWQQNNTVAQNELIYTKRELEEAKQGRELYRMLAYPSYKDISETITCGTLIDYPVTI